METDKLCDIYAYEFVPFWHTSSFYLLVGITIVMLLIGISIWYYRWRFKQRTRETAWQKAFKALSEIGAQKLSHKLAYKAAYFSLTVTIKAYLYEEHGWPVLHKTDEELITFLQSKNIDKNTIELLEQIVQGMLEIKFADAQALQENYQRHIQCAQEFIKQTIKQQTDENTR